MPQAVRRERSSTLRYLRMPRRLGEQMLLCWVVRTALNLSCLHVRVDFKNSAGALVRFDDGRATEKQNFKKNRTTIFPRIVWFGCRSVSRCQRLCGCSVFVGFAER